MHALKYIAVDIVTYTKGYIKFKYLVYFIDYYLSYY